VRLLSDRSGDLRRNSANDEVAPIPGVRGHGEQRAS
jgi:hypothetical protein